MIPNECTSSVKLKYLHVSYPPCIKPETQSRSDKVETLNSSRTRIENQHVTFRIPDNLEDVGMTAYQYIWLEFIHQLAGFCVISARVPSHMYHQDLEPLALEEPVDWVCVAKIIVVAVS